ncbi:MAG TPA: serpin family protein [Nocardioides sp.]|nr:serpin family protein [Nocardioides sp.]
MSACGSDPDRSSGATPTPAPEPGGLRLVSSDAERAVGDAAAVPDAVFALHALGAGLYAELSGDGDNLALSPYSVGVALAMTQNGARGATLEEMTGVLGGVGPGGLNGGLNALTAHVEALAGTQRRLDGTEAEIALRAANTLFGEATTTFEQEFLDVLASEYGAGLQAVDFRHDFEAARVAINDWTAERTEGRIEDLVPEGAIDDLTRLVLVNALYLKAPWEETFEKELTDDRDFHLVDGSTVPVPTMTLETRAGWLGAGDGWQALRMPYAGQAVAMTIVLPERGRLADVEAAVAEGGLRAMLDSVQPAQVAISLPRWSFRTQAPLKDTLAALGMVTAFDEHRADFSGMTAEEKLFIAAVLHQTFVAVDEEGTEAAAATAVVMQVESMPQYVPFTADRPFLFVIHDVEHGTPLFLGRVADPRSA